MKALVCGAGGFIGSHLVERLKQRGYWVLGVDLKYPEFSITSADEFMIRDLRNQRQCDEVFNMYFDFDEVYQLAADMGGAGYVFTGDHDFDIMSNSACININVANRVQRTGAKLFFSSSACIYPEHNQDDPDKPDCSEGHAYPAQPDSEYGWEKIFSERLYLSCQRNYGLDVRIARFHNIFGPNGTWKGGKEKAPAALCRKVAETKNGGVIDIWGDGKQTRSFLYIDECLDGIERLMKCKKSFEPMNLGSDEMVTINKLAEMIIYISGKKLLVNHIPGPLGVRGRSSDNELIQKNLDWQPNYSLLKGLGYTYEWINKQVHKK